MQALRDNPDCASEEYDRHPRRRRPGPARPSAPSTRPRTRPPRSSLAERGPRLAILREQGVNGQVEMAAAFDRAGFERDRRPHERPARGARRLCATSSGFAACGGFSYGDVLGAGGGWAKSILFNARARDEFDAFFARPDTFALGVCNGCQMMAQLKEIIPGRRGLAALRQEPLRAVRGALRHGRGPGEPVALLPGHGRQPHPGGVAHGEGQGCLRPAADAATTDGDRRALRFVDNRGRATEQLPRQPQRLAARASRQ